MDARTIQDEIAALDEGRAFARVPLRVVRILGADAHRWSNDLLTAGVDPVPEGGTRSFLLTPTGRIRADLFVLAEGDDVLLVQPTDQPRPVDDLLRPYVLTSEVRLERVDDAEAVVVPGPLGWAAVAAPAAHLLEVPGSVFEAWRVRRGHPRFPGDLDEASQPAEAPGLAAAVDQTKGCFLGQEAVAKVRNLGHPTRLLVAARGSAVVTVGTDVVADGKVVGLVTSAVGLEEGEVAAILRIRWDARDLPLGTPEGATLSRA